MITIFAPIAYLAFLVISLTVFSKIYRRKGNEAAPTPWFPQHKSRDLYVSLLSMEPPPARPILIAALLRRAMDDVKLIWSIRDSKASLGVLLQRGQIGDELWERFCKAEKELEAEITEVVGEANTFQEGYGQQIFGVASDMVNHEKWKEIFEGIPAAREAENARIAQGSSPAAQILAPFTYLTPSSLSLSPSNPIPESVASTTSPNTNGTLAPAPASAPPTRGNTPLPSAAAVATNGSVPSPAKEPVARVIPSPLKAQTPIIPLSPTKPPTLPPIPTSPTPSMSPTSPTTPTTPGTPGSKKKNKKKKKPSAVTEGVQSPDE